MQRAAIFLGSAIAVAAMGCGDPAAFCGAGSRDALWASNDDAIATGNDDTAIAMGRCLVDSGCTAAPGLAAAAGAPACPDRPAIDDNTAALAGVPPPGG